MRNPDELTVDLDAGAAIAALVYRSDLGAAAQTLILAHGAGAGHRSPFMVAFARALAASGSDVVTFNFPYMEAGRRLPDRRPVLEACYRTVIDRVRALEPHAPLFIGGKSMGGRIATQVAAGDSGLALAGLVLLGYPLHPPGRPDQRRDAHLAEIQRPMLFVQGSRDAFGTPAEFEPLLPRLMPTPTFHVVAGGDHSLAVRGGGQAAQAAVYEQALRAIADWMRDVTRRGPETPPRRG